MAKKQFEFKYFMLNFKAFYCRAANRNNGERSNPPRGRWLEGGRLGGRESPPLSVMLLFVSKQLATAVPGVGGSQRRHRLLAFWYTFPPHGRLGGVERAESNRRRQVMSSPPMSWFFFLKNFFCTMNFCAFSTCMSMPRVHRNGGETGCPSRKSIRCGCCSGNETFHDQSGKRCRGRENGEFSNVFFSSSFRRIRNYANRR